MGLLVCGLICLAKGSPAPGAYPTPEAAYPLFQFHSQAEGSAEANVGSARRLIVQIPGASLQRLYYLSGLLIVLSVMLAWHCWDYWTNKQTASLARVAPRFTADQRSPELVS